MNPTEEHRQGHRRPKSPATHASFVPLLLIALTLVLMTGFQALQLTRERGLLQERLTRLEKPLKEAAQVRRQLEAIARGTARLARQGNTNARQVVAQLRRAGITINPDAKPMEKGEQDGP